MHTLHCKYTDKIREGLLHRSQFLRTVTEFIPGFDFGLKVPKRDLIIFFMSAWTHWF